MKQKKFISICIAWKRVQAYCMEAVECYLFNSFIFSQDRKYCLRTKTIRGSGGETAKVTIFSSELHFIYIWIQFVERTFIQQCTSFRTFAIVYLPSSVIAVVVITSLKPSHSFFSFLHSAFPLYAQLSFLLCFAAWLCWCCWVHSCIKYNPNIIDTNK